MQIYRDCYELPQRGDDDRKMSNLVNRICGIIEEQPSPKSVPKNDMRMSLEDNIIVPVKSEAEVCTHNIIRTILTLYLKVKDDMDALLRLYNPPVINYDDLLSKELIGKGASCVVCPSFSRLTLFLMLIRFTVLC